VVDVLKTLKDDIQCELTSLNLVDLTHAVVCCDLENLELQGANEADEFRKVNLFFKIHNLA
jgi:hypothetical protein